MNPGIIFLSIYLVICLVVAVVMWQAGPDNVCNFVDEAAPLLLFLFPSLLFCAIAWVVREIARFLAWWLKLNGDMVRQKKEKQQKTNNGTQTA